MIHKLDTNSFQDPWGFNGTEIDELMNMTRKIKKRNLVTVSDQDPTLGRCLDDPSEGMIVKNVSIVLQIRETLF